MASTKDQAELNKLIAKLTPACPQPARSSRSGLGRALAEIANAVDSTVAGGEYYAKENKSLSRKINELTSENQLLRSASRYGGDDYDRQNRGLSKKINDVIRENQQLKAESAALGVENLTWKTFYAQLMAGGAFNAEPARPQYGAMNQDRWQRMAPTAAAAVPRQTTAATGPVRASLERDKATHLASHAAAPEQRPAATQEIAPMIAAKESKKRSYSDVDAAPPAKVPKLDYGHPIVRQAVKATAWTPGDSKVTAPKFGETMFGPPATADEIRKPMSKDVTKSAVPQLGEAMFGAPAPGAPGTDDHRSKSEPKHDFQFTLPKTFGALGTRGTSDRCSWSEPRESAKLAVPKLGETMFGAPDTHDSSFKMESKDLDEVL
ncbi:hypothetical protein LTR36_000125 [Oleoguttula mirabilis]|uniref:Uncharacterized protein n=1 Tax=Oleoguttula mirabilis TaxID=1507867 RepID=A0AAV9JXN8_9PEZI|nr:hypothetical protein LTR36_000125 [Oleoguttula mirabilis]